MSDKLLPVAIVPLRAKPIARQLWENWPGCFVLGLLLAGCAVGWWLHGGKW